MGTLLVVDDNAELCRMLGRFLTRAGHRCLCANSADEAMTILKGQIPDLVLADVMMPDTSGLDLLRTMRKDDRTREVPVVIFSAVSEERYVNEAMALGADDYWLKGSLKAGDLETRIRAFLPDHASDHAAVV